MIVDAPHVVKAKTDIASDDDDSERAWWLHEDPNAPEDLGLSVSVEYIRDIMINQVSIW